MLSVAGVGSLASLFEIHVKNDVTLGGIIGLLTVVLQLWLKYRFDREKKKRNMSEYYLSSFIGKTLKTLTAVNVYKRADISTTPIAVIATGRNTPKIASFIEGKKVGSSFDWFEISFANGQFDTAFIPAYPPFYNISPAVSQGLQTSSVVDAKRAEIDAAYAASQEPSEVEKWAWRVFWVGLGLGVTKIAASSLVQYFKK